MRTGQPAQTALACATCCSAGPEGAMGKNRSGSLSRQAPRDAQLAETARAGGHMALCSAARWKCSWSRNTIQRARAAVGRHPEVHMPGGILAGWSTGTTVPASRSQGTTVPAVERVQGCASRGATPRAPRAPRCRPLGSAGRSSRAARLRRGLRDQAELAPGWRSLCCWRRRDPAGKLLPDALSCSPPLRKIPP